MACWALANEAAAAETFEPEANHERELDPDYWPPCFFASAAEAGGATWEANADTNRRTEFWRWYLLNASPPPATPTDRQPDFPASRLSRRRVDRASGCPVTGSRF
jgi:hypothetical protein